MNASGSGDNGKYCGKTLRKPDNADEKDGTDGKDDTDDTEQCGQYGRYERYELVRTGANWCESATQWTGRRCGESGKSRESGERIERKKQACENAGPTTRPESRSES